MARPDTRVLAGSLLRQNLIYGWPGWTRATALTLTQLERRSVALDDRRHRLRNRRSADRSGDSNERGSWTEWTDNRRLLI